MTKHKLIIVGASGHAKVIIDVFEQIGNYKILGLFDDRISKDTEVLGHKLLGKTAAISSFLTDNTNIEVFIAIGDNWTRSRVKKQLEQNNANIHWANAIHPQAQIGKGTVFGKGVAILAGAVINSDARIGDFTIMGSNSILDHDSHLGAYASLAPGATVGGNVQIGNFSTVSLGANIIHGIKIGAHTVIGAGTTVLQNFGENLVVFGSPAREIRTREEGEKYL
ncbi:MAG: acetyltransferase [Cytophagales bacterium]|nr:acetyltransferase [Cytophagales bacterium]